MAVEPADQTDPRPRLAYCTNVAPAPSADALRQSLGDLWADVRRQVDPGGVLGLGLWFEEAVARELAADPGAADGVREALDASGLALVTVNAFPQRAFHADVVKEAVYRPDWTEPERAAYTLDVARAASRIAGPGADVTLSTLPLGYPKFDEARLRKAAEQIGSVVAGLDRLHGETGTTVRLAMEPEPMCAVETTAEAIDVWESIGQMLLTDPGEGVFRRHFGVCLDLCHAAVEHEDPVEAFQRYAAAGVPVFKVQVSAALDVPDPKDAATRQRLEAFAEPRWLHQVGAGPGNVVLDLPQALSDDTLASSAPWRVHFHVPLFRDEVGGLPTTRHEVERFLAHVLRAESPPVLELETYTWSVVPGAGDDVAANVAREIRWVADRLG